jgi:hypothetical protein
LPRPVERAFWRLIAEGGPTAGAAVAGVLPLAAADIVTVSQWTTRRRYAPHGASFEGLLIAPDWAHFAWSRSGIGRSESVAMQSRPDEVSLQPVDDPAQRGRQQPTAGPVDEHTDGGRTGGNATTTQGAG